MTTYSPIEEDALSLLQELIDVDEEMYDGRQILGFFDNDTKRAGRAFKLLLGAGFVAEKAAFFSDGSNLPSWVYAVYEVSPTASLALNKKMKGVNPFDMPEKKTYHGDFYETNISKNEGAIAIGRKSTANYYGSGDQQEKITQILSRMAEALEGLSKANQEDGQYQIAKLTEAARVGPEAIQEREKPFLSWLETLKNGIEGAQAFAVLYKLAILLFALFGIQLPELPEAL